MLMIGAAWRRARHLLQPLVGACLALYFGYYAIYGARGLLAVQQLEERVAAAKEVLALETERRAALERRVALLRPNSLDPDLLEERARSLLNIGRAPDVIVVNPTRDAAKKPVRVTSP